MSSSIITLIKMIMVCIIICVLYSCENQDIIYNKYKPDNGDGNSHLVSDSVLIRFTATINKLNSRSTSPISASRYVNVYSYRDDIRLYSNKFYSKESGTLSPVGYSLFLTGGTYNLYSVCINNENIVAPSFNDTIYSGIKNNTDYIWGDLLSVSPSGTAQDYVLNFNHSCTQIQLAVSLTNTITVDSIYSIGIAPSDTTDVT